MQDAEAIYEQLAHPLREARRSLMALCANPGMELYRFASARANEVPHGSHEDKVRWKERFVREAAATFVSEPLGPKSELQNVYDAHVLKPMLQVMGLIDDLLGAATVPEKLAVHRHITAGHSTSDQESPIRSAINLLIASTVPASDMNY